MFTKIAVISILGVLCTISSSAQTGAPIRLQRTIVLEGVRGKFDHFAIDEVRSRLFAAATGDNSVEVIDLVTGKTTQSLAGLGKPHGLVWIADTGRLFVADGTKGELDVFEGSPLKIVKSVRLAEDADDMVYDRTTGLLYIGNGGTDAANPAAVSIVDASRLTLVATLPMAAHPEALDQDPEGHRIFANISDTGEIVVIDGRTHAISGKWTLRDEKGNTPMAYDADDGLLLVGCRRPAKLLVLNGKTGREISSATSAADADDLFYESSTHRAYLVTGSGSVNSYALSADGKLQPMPVTTTPPGAKTGLLVPSQKALYVGIPGTNKSAEIRVYGTDRK